MFQGLILFGFSQNILFSGKKTPGKGKVKNTNSETFPCDECDSTYLTYNGLFNHKSVHKGATFCTECDINLSSKSYLKVHLKKKHGLEVE